jgi:hypothetical protein
MRWVDHAANVGTVQYKMLVSKCKGQKPLGRPRHRLDNIQVDLRKIMSGLGLQSSGSKQGLMACL